MILINTGHHDVMFDNTPQPNSLHDIIEVRDSEIHGLGVFAACDLEAGFEMVIHGYLTSVPSIYCFYWDESTVFEPYAPFKYLNHTDSPNCEVYDDHFGVMLHLLEDIPKGGELTINYYGE